MTKISKLHKLDKKVKHFNFDDKNDELHKLGREITTVNIKGDFIDTANLHEKIPQ